MICYFETRLSVQYKWDIIVVNLSSVMCFVFKTFLPKNWRKTTIIENGFPTKYSKLYSFKNRYPVILINFFINWKVHYFLWICNSWPKVYLILYPTFWELDNPNCHIVYWTYLSNKSKLPIIQYTYINGIHFYKKRRLLLSEH